MSLKDYEIEEYEQNIKDLPDKVTGKAAWLKDFFDGRGDKEIRNAINGIITLLTESDGAKEIGAVAPASVVIDPNVPVSVQNVLYGLKRYTDQKVVDIGTGDMAQAIYDSNSNGVVDDAEKLGGKTPESYISSEWVLNEVIIGNHESGKPLYRKGIHVASLPNAGQVAYPHGVINIANAAVDINRSVVSWPNGVDSSINIIRFSPTSMATSFSIIGISSVAITLEAGIDRSNLSAVVFITYTKTTD